MCQPCFFRVRVCSSAGIFTFPYIFFLFILRFLFLYHHSTLTLLQQPQPTKSKDEHQHATNDHEQDPLIPPFTSPSTIRKPSLFLLPKRPSLDPHSPLIYPSIDPIDPAGQLQFLVGCVPCKDVASDCIGPVVFDPVWAGVQDQADRD